MNNAPLPLTSESPKRVIVAMSGGVDSSVVAGLMKEAGHEVIGLTLQLYDSGAFSGRTKACCAGQDIYDARVTADKIGIPHYVLDYESRFKEAVIEDFADSYLRGETPIPCVRCNQEVKFKDLLATARELGGDVLVTGHYVRWESSSEPELHRAVDVSRDQSYFLFSVSREQLAYLRFPLGSLTKDAVRLHAKRLGIPVADKPDSQDICFVPDGNYASVIERLRPEAADPGAILDLEGRLLGAHKGIIHYTVGQRRGLQGLLNAQGESLYVVKIDAAQKAIIVGPKSALACPAVFLRDVNWLGAPEAEPFELSVKVRSSQEPVPAKVRLTPNNTAHVIFEQAEYGVSCGQACVFYQGTRVLGGGWIERAPLGVESAPSAS